MLDQIPEHAWVLLGIVTAAFGPARYLYRYVSHSPRGHDITQPPVDFGWRTRPLLFRNLGALIVMVGLAVFIFTPAAKDFALSEYLRSLAPSDDAAESLVRVPEVVALPDSQGSLEVRQKALFEYDRGDPRAALDLLTQALREDPNDADALRMRADIYWELGEEEKSKDDEDRLYQLEAEARAARRFGPLSGM